MVPDDKRPAYQRSDDAWLELVDRSEHSVSLEDLNRWKDEVAGPPLVFGD